jgi:hypothetical protein
MPLTRSPSRPARSAAPQVNAIRLLVWAIGLTTVAVYLMATWHAWRLVTVQLHYPRWWAAWICFTLACALASFQRLYTALTAPRTLIWRDIVALIVSLCLLSFVSIMVGIFCRRPSEKGSL